MVGVVGYGVDTAALYAALHYLYLDPYSGRILSYLVAATATWFLNRNLTFRGKSEGSILQQWLHFLVLNLGGFILNYLTYSTLVTFSSLFARELWLAVAAGSLAGMIANYWVAKRMIFRG
jgi:putative flippase GtrA